MLFQQAVLSLVLATGALLFALLFLYLYRNKRQPHVLGWALGWLVLAASAGTEALLPPSPLGVPAGPTSWLMSLALIVFVGASWVYARQVLRWRVLAGFAAAALVWALGRHFGLLRLPLGTGNAFLFFLTARIFWNESKRWQSEIDVALSVALSSWGVLVFLRALQPRAPQWLPFDLRLPMLLPGIFTAVLMIMLVYEQDRRQVEKDILALSNLNLATSGFAGSEIQKMLSQALERVLNVGRLETGVLYLRYGDQTGSVFVAAEGVRESFRADMGTGGLNEYLVKLVARLGGLVVLRDLKREASWMALEREVPFKRFRDLLVKEGLRTVVGISLQSKEQVFGLMMLGDTRNRQFTPAELRLLLALGHQIGMAVENSYLVEQSERRNEEMHILNEIGRALSSTLNTDELFETMYSEMRRLFDFGRFFVALHDTLRNEICFELEVVDNVRQPKQRRPVGRHLVEHIMETRQPVLIREHFVEEMERLGFAPMGTAASFCGVPLILFGQALGAICLHSSEENAFDEGHLELLRILANEASIALANARLFSEEQRKARQLALLNNISRHAIATLSPEEMLARLAESLEESLTYDYVGIAVFDPVNRELVMQAEAGHLRGALGRHFALGEKLIGQVARTCEAAVVSDGLREGATILEQSASAVALPVHYADELLGVLCAESLDRYEFSEEEVRFLRTLTDLVAASLHNALALQRAREQAITDGLTGVKTHRYMMESLSAEWKRATRSGRPFSVLLMDLDRFKFVNDFYGHLEGDVVLQVVGRILEQNCRRSDVVARYGGDEFVILMPETNAEPASQLAAKLRSLIAADPLLLDKGITASFGIAVHPEHGATPPDLIQAADAAMYLSKHQGGNMITLGSAPRAARPGGGPESFLILLPRRHLGTGPEAFEEVKARFEQYSRSMAGCMTAENCADVPAQVVEAIVALAVALDGRVPFAQGHSRRVCDYAMLLARRAGVTGEEAEEVRLAALLHDVGRLGVPEIVLNKPDRLTAEEWEAMRTHSVLGGELLKPVRAFRRVEELVRHHHEAYDGTGYPDKLKGTQIPMGVRILAIADAYDSMTSPRAFRPALTPEQALSELERCSGKQFDPELTHLFVSTVHGLPNPLLDATYAISAAQLEEMN
jgi:diguanylate cyclase (GGDEF)-like protein